jgi:hypothetical protein
MRFEHNTVGALAKFIFLGVEDKAVVALVSNLLHFDIGVRLLGLVVFAFAWFGFCLCIQGLLQWLLSLLRQLICDVLHVVSENWTLVSC